MTRTPRSVVGGLCVIVAALVAACSPTSDEPAASFPGSAGATEWRVGAQPAGGAEDAHGVHDTPDALFDAFVFSVIDPPGTPPDDASGTLTPIDDDTSVAMIQVSGYPDDSIAGEEYRVLMQRGPDGWYVESVEVRTHCRRGVSDGVCV